LGHGIALARSSFAADFLASQRLVALPQPELEAKDQVYLTTALGLSSRAPAALFRDYLLSRSPP
jgi:DNA-binding transcriptional LysR family regulator